MKHGYSSLTDLLNDVAKQQEQISQGIQNFEIIENQQKQQNDKLSIDNDEKNNTEEQQQDSQGKLILNRFSFEQSERQHSFRGSFNDKLQEEKNFQLSEDPNQLQLEELMIKNQNLSNDDVNKEVHNIQNSFSFTQDRKSSDQIEYDYSSLSQTKNQTEINSFSESQNTLLNTRGDQYPFQEKSPSEKQKPKMIDIADLKNEEDIIDKDKSLDQFYSNLSQQQQQRQNTKQSKEQKIQIDTVQEENQPYDNTINPIFIDTTQSYQDVKKDFMSLERLKTKSN